MDFVAERIEQFWFYKDHSSTFEKVEICISCVMFSKKLGSSSALY